MAWEAFDFETAGKLSEYGLQPWRVKDNQAWVRSWAVARADGNYAYKAACDPRSVKEQLRPLVQRWVDEKTTVCVWNGLFDISWLIAYGLYPEASKVKWLDGMLLWKHLEQSPEYDTPNGKRQSFGLKTAVAKHLPQYAGYDEGVDFEGGMLELLHYNACDAWFTRALTRHFYNQLEESNPQRLRAALIESHCLPAVARANYNGVPIDNAGLWALSCKLTEQRRELEAELAEHGATKEILASPKKLGSLLFDDWGLTPLKHGKTGPSTDKETLLELAVYDDRLLKIHLHREAKGNWKKFVDNVGQSVTYNNDGRSHPQARVFGTYTGRFTYNSNQGKGVNLRQTGFALHQMKRDNRYRQLVSAPKGYKVVELDAAGQEFRWMAEISGDETMRHLCRPGEDPHSYMGAEVSGIDYREIQEGAKHDKTLGAFRQMGKVGNLSLQFRTSAKTLLRTARIQHGMMDMTLPKAELVHQTYRRTYPGVPMYWARQTHFVKQHGYVETLAGRRITVPRHLLAKYEWSVESTSINYPIQGTGGDQKYLALSVIRPLLDQLDVIFLFDLHDGLYFLVPDDVVDYFITTARALFDNLPYQKAWGVTPSIPLPWDVKVGDSWGNMTEL